jgi:hypothetical protein
MPIPFECPKCQAKYEVADAMAGKTILCRKCDQRVPVGGQAAAAGDTHTPAGVPSTRRKVLLALAYAVPAGLLVTAGVYYWSRPLPWERARRGEDPFFPGGPPPGGGPPGGGPPPGGPPPGGPPGGPPPGGN